ncbi:MAG: hypothetical protein HKP55_05860 [Gammaproteobacteria bacterium]|nr:hypothetical protein [Gammaproteobacteria bacterium]NNJ91180.1 hypothetical protein [Gammaproteobacteria bacterium]
MELQSKKLMKEIKDLDMINDADIDTSELSDSLDLTSAEVGKFQHQTAPKDKEVN